MRVLFFGTYDEGRHPRVKVLRQGLGATSGFEVRTLNRPLTDSTSERIEAARSPRAALRWLAELGRSWAWLLRASFREPVPDVVIVGYLGVLDVVLARLRWPRKIVVLDHMAPLRGIAADRGLGRTASLLLALVDAMAERISDFVLFDTAENAALSTALAAKRLVVPVGAPDDWFEAATAEPPDSKVLKVIFFGLFTPLQGAPTIGAAIRRLAGQPVAFTMVGTGQELAEAKKLAGPDSSVRWIAWVSASALPRLVAEHDVCLGIFGTTTKALRVVPNKVFQGAAAGSLVVTLDSEPQRRVLGEGAVYVPPGDPQALEEAIVGLLSDRALLVERRQLSRQTAESFRPERTVQRLVRPLLDPAPPNMRSTPT